MTVESRFLLKFCSDGVRVTACEESKALLPKKECHHQLLKEILEVLDKNDPFSTARLIEDLYSITQSGGWDKAPIAYFLRHQGWALLPVLGTEDELWLVVRSSEYLNRV